MSPTFQQLNDGWNAEPNAPGPKAEWVGNSLRLTFLMNALQFPEFDEGDIGELVFKECSRFRIGALNDEGWYCGQGRFGREDPQWGEFYEITGGLECGGLPEDWTIHSEDSEGTCHFLSYFRDEDFECLAKSWAFKTIKAQVAAQNP